MKTKDLIKEASKDLFSKKGLKNITLREIAKVIGKSYGNVTYHFSTKEKLLEALFLDFNDSLELLQKENISCDNLLHYFLLLPDYSFDLTVEYLFFYLDYVEIKRTYPKLAKEIEILNTKRKSKWKELMIVLQTQGFLKANLTHQELELIMELSTGMRLLYFQENINKELDKTIFSLKVNQLLFPYLSEKGMVVYSSF